MENTMTFSSISIKQTIAALAAITLACIGPAAFAQAPVADKDYKLISPPVPPKGNKIEVIEFFSYACPHCAEFEHPLRAWLKKKPADVEFRAVPLIFRESWAPLARLFYSLEAMGLTEKLHGKVFSAIHAENKTLEDADGITKWVESQGVDGKKFADVYNSFGMGSKLDLSKKTGREHGVPFTPAITINGKYLTGVSMTKGPDGNPSTQRLFQVVEALIAMERSKAAAPQKKTEAKPKEVKKKLATATEPK